MLMVAVMVSFLALLIGLAAMWMAGGASRKAEVQHHTFFESHIKGLKQSLSDISKTVGDMGGQLAKLQQTEGEEDGNSLESRLSALEEKVNRIGEAVNKIGSALSVAK
jgi:hypothetical protein